MMTANLFRSFKWPAGLGRRCTPLPALRSNTLPTPSLVRPFPPLRGPSRLYPHRFVPRRSGVLPIKSNFHLATTFKRTSNEHNVHIRCQQSLSHRAFRCHLYHIACSEIHCAKLCSCTGCSRVFTRSLLPGTTLLRRPCRRREQVVG